MFREAVVPLVQLQLWSRIAEIVFCHSISVLHAVNSGRVEPYLSMS